MRAISDYWWLPLLPIISLILIAGMSAVIRVCFRVPEGELEVLQDLRSLLGRVSGAPPRSASRSDLRRIAARGALSVVIRFPGGDFHHRLRVLGLLGAVGVVVWVGQSSIALMCIGLVTAVILYSLGIVYRRTAVFDTLPTTQLTFLVVALVVVAAGTSAVAMTHFPVDASALPSSLGAGLVLAWSLREMSVNIVQGRSATEANCVPFEGGRSGDLRDEDGAPTPPVPALERYLRHVHEQRLLSSPFARVQLLPVTVAVSIGLVPRTREFSIVRACLLFEARHHSRAKLVALDGNESLEPPSTTLAAIATLARIRLGQFRAAELDIRKQLETDVENPFALYQRAFLNWQLGELDEALQDSREALRCLRLRRRGPRVPLSDRSTARAASLHEAAIHRLIAQVLCQKSLEDPEGAERDPAHLLLSATEAVCEAEQALAGEVLWPLVYTRGLLSMCSGELRDAALKFYACALHRRDAGAIYRLGVLSMIGTETYNRAEPQFLQMLDLDGVNSRLREQASRNLERVSVARRRGVVFTERILRYQDALGADLLPEDCIASAAGEVEQAREARRGALRASLSDLWVLRSWKQIVEPNPTQQLSHAARVVARLRVRVESTGEEPDDIR